MRLNIIFFGVRQCTIFFILILSGFLLRAQLTEGNEVLVGFDMNNFEGIDVLTPPDYVLFTTDVAGSFTHPNLETLSLSVGPGFNGNQQAGFYRFNTPNGVPTSPVISDNYMEFTIAPQTGFAFSLQETNSIQIHSRTYDSDFSPGIFIRSSLDDFSTTLDVFEGVGDGITRSFDLPGFNEISESVTFRVYLFDPDGSANWSVRNNGSLGDTGNLEFVINGSIIQGEIVSVTGVELSSEEESLLIGETLQLEATVFPEGATDQGLTWSSNSPEIVSVSSSGLISAIGDGTATITVTTDDGGFQDNVIITSEVVLVTGISVVQESLTLAINETSQLTYTLTPENPTNPNIVWISSNEGVATVDENGLVTAIDNGVATITGTTEDGGFSDFSSITVTNEVLAGIGALDAEGWTILQPSADSRLVYVSSSEGNDANDGLTPETAKATIDAADALIRDGFPDWLMLKRGDVFQQPNLGRWKNGRSASEPLVMTYYGDSGPRPIIILNDILIYWNGQPRNHQAFVGLDLYRSISDPNSPDFTNTSSANGMFFNAGNNDAFNVLVEDCRFRYCWLVPQGQREEFFLHNVHIRRNIIMNNWAHGSTDDDARIQGMFVRGVVDIYLEENLFHHNGWSEVIEDANANQFNHNLYMSAHNDGEILVRGNILSFGSAHGVQLRSGGKAVMNAFVGNAIGMNIGYSSPPSFYLGDTFVEDNVLTDGRPQIPNDFSNPQTGAIWGLWNQSLNTIPIVNDNIVANILDDRGGNIRPYNSFEANEFGTGNIGWNWVNGNDPDSDPGWLDPDRNALGFAQTLGFGSWNAFIEAASNRPLGQMPIDISAYAYIDYVREGFNKSAVAPPYQYDETCDGISVQGINLISPSITLAEIGETQELLITFDPIDACNRRVQWSSSDESVATVDEGGIVTAVGQGVATISVETQEGGFVAMTDVTVTGIIEVTGVSIERETLSLGVSEEAALVAAVSPENATETSVTWSSSDETVAIVNEEGLVTGLSNGSAIITVTTVDGSFTDEVSVTVSGASINYLLDAVNIDYDGSGNQGGAAQIIQEGSDVRSLYPYDGEVFLPSPEGTWPEGYGGWSYLTPNSTDPNHRLIYRNNPDELRFQNATGGTIDALVYYELEAPAIFNQLNLSMTLGGGTGTGTATVFFVAKVGDNFYVSAEGENSINTTFELASGDTDWQLWDFSTNGGDNFKVTFNDLIPANGSNVNAIGFYITGSGSGGVIRNLRQLSYQSEMAQNSVPVILTQILDNGVVGVPYSASLSAEGGDGEVLWSISSGNLPDGLTLNEEGMIFGTPTLADTVEFSVLAIDSDDNDSENDQDIQELSIVINPGVGVLTLLDLIQAYDGTPKSPTAITDPENLSVTFIYNGVEEEPTLPGTYTVEANISDPNYTGSTKDTLIISSAVLVRHGLTLNGEIYGSVQTLLPENITLNGASFIKGDILISGVPTIIQNGNSSYKELINSTGSSAPTHHQIMLNGNSSVEDIVIRVDPIGLPLVEAPSSPEGTDDVFINNSGDEVSDWESLRNLTINGNVSPVSVPPGTYGNFTSNGNGGLSLGTNGSEVPARYNFERLTLNGNGQIQVDGPVIITVNSGLNINGIFGSSDDPSLLVLRIHNGGLTLNGNAEFNGIVHSPSGTVVVNDNSKLNGEVVADRLIVNGNGQIHQVLPKYTNFRISEENNDQVEIETVDLVGRYGLRSNYPNPFHESTLIRYDLPITVEVNIEILDLTGRSIKRIVEETQGPGNYLLEFDASELQKGTYILNFRINNFNQSIRIIKN